MYSFTAQQRFTALVWLSLFHIAIITSSNYLVQLPITVFGFHTTWGAFTFPFIFLATDLTVRIFGAPLAPDYPGGDGAGAVHLLRDLHRHLSGRVAGFAALGSFNLFVARIAVASFMAYVLGQILDVHVFNRLRQRSLVGSAGGGDVLRQHQRYAGVLLHRLLQEQRSFMANNWVEIALVDYSFKVMICLLFFLPMYGVLLNMLLKRIAARSGSLQLS